MTVKGGSPRAKRPAGFTLIEIALALGIVAFALSAIMGLLPFGLGFAREAVQNTVGANIMGAVMNDIRQRSFNQITVGTETFWYDEQGFAVEQPQAIYEVKAETTPGGLPRASNAEDSTDPEPNLKQIALRIAHNPGGTRASIPDSEYTRYAAFVARTESRGANSVSSP